jgi:hypothetical protein
MDRATLALLQSAEKAVSRLVEACHKTRPLFRRNPRATAQVSRTGKWLLNAIEQLKRQPDAAS